MKIYTKTGDAGSTGLIGGQRVPKNSLRISAIGDVDELNAAIGWARCLGVAELDEHLGAIQNTLFEVGAELASPGEDRFETVSDEAAKILESSIDAMTASLPELRNFILPGGSEEAARLHLARSICRRCERTLLELHQNDAVRETVRIYVNRLSDWLFVAARTANRLKNVQDVDWRRGN